MEQEKPLFISIEQQQNLSPEQVIHGLEQVLSTASDEEITPHFWEEHQDIISMVVFAAVAIAIIGGIILGLQHDVSGKIENWMENLPEHKRMLLYGILGGLLLAAIVGGALYVTYNAPQLPTGGWDYPH